MTREEAIKLLVNATFSDEWQGNEDLTTAYRMAIEALKKEPCEDVISRRAVLEQINCWIGSGEYRYTNATYYLTERVKHISSVKPQESKWIPVSERLPEESINSVIGWDAYRERCVFVQYLDGQFQITGKPESFDIKAWMPLPEPYKAESENKE